MSNPIDISHLNKSAVLAALYNASRPLGMGFMQFNPKPMTEHEACEILKRCTYFDYLYGRVMKADLSGSALDPWGYDRDNGDGAAARAISALAIGGPNAPSIEKAGHAGTKSSAESVRARLATKSTVNVEDGIVVARLGLADVAGEIGEKVNQAIQHQNQ